MVHKKHERGEELGYRFISEIIFMEVSSLEFKIQLHNTFECDFFSSFIPCLWQR